jgi:hypothetical protein
MAEPQLKAIETEYKGYLFRSRLEARWAVFMDCLGVRWEYEKEGLDLEGVWYLPDFWLPGHKRFVEIKPIRDDGKLDLAKPTALAQSGAAVIVLVGNPWPWEYMVYASIADRLVAHPSAQWSRCPDCGETCLVISSLDGERSHGTVSWDLRDHSCKCTLFWLRPGERPSPSHPVGPAYLAARQTRFDRGGSAPVPQQVPGPPPVVTEDRPPYGPSVNEYGGWVVGMMVEHRDYGLGTIRWISGCGAMTNMQVDFESVGQRVFRCDKAQMAKLF